MVFTDWQPRYASMASSSSTSRPPSTATPLTSWQQLRKASRSWHQCLYCLSGSFSGSEFLVALLTPLNRVWVLYQHQKYIVVFMFAVMYRNLTSLGPRLTDPRTGYQDRSWTWSHGQHPKWNRCQETVVAFTWPILRPGIICHSYSNQSSIFWCSCCVHLRWNPFIKDHNNPAEKLPSL
jgi:hypothetical protein